MSTTTRVDAGPGRPNRSQQLGCAVLIGFLAAMAAVLGLGPVLAGHLAYVITGRPWPHTKGLPWGAWHLWAHPGTPLQDWPSPQGRPASWIMWTLEAGLLTAVLAAVLAGAIGVHHFVRPRRAGTGGMASAKQESRALTKQALHLKAPELRPTLVATTAPREIRTEQLGTWLGRSVGTGQEIYQNAETSAIVSGLTGSGKTTSVIVPSILDWEGPQLNSTTKVDIIRSTWQVAADRGGLAVFDLLNLTGGVFPSLKWTPLAGCGDPDVADSRSSVLMDRGATSHDPNADFRAEGKRVVRALVHAAGLADATVSEMLAWVYHPLDQHPEQVIRRAGGRGYQLYADELAAVRRSPDKQREGAYLSVRGAMDGLSSPQVLRGIDIRPSQAFSIPAWLDSGFGSVYLISHKKMLAGAEKVVSIMVADVLETARRKAAASAGGRLDPLLNFWADEAVNACQLSDWDTVLADSRGWGISAKMAIQSRALLRGRYGRDPGEAIWSAAGSRLMVGGGEGGTDTKELAESFGEHEVATHSVNSGGGGSMGSRQQAVRTTANVRNLDPGRGILLATQMPPIELELRPWWDRADAAQITRATRDYDQARAERGHLAATAMPGAGR